MPGQAMAGGETGAAAPLRVLVVDDEDTVRTVVARMLQVDNHQVDACGSGREAISIFMSGKFDLVVTDRAMPGMIGDELAVRLSALDPDVPILMLTGYGELMADREPPPAGVTMVLSKPVGIERLRQAVAAVAGKRGDAKA